MLDMDFENELAYEDLKDSMHLMKTINNIAYPKNENTKELVN